jgi:hypothetical protein
MVGVVPRYIVFVGKSCERCASAGCSRLVCSGGTYIFVSTVHHRLESRREKSDTDNVVCKGWRVVNVVELALSLGVCLISLMKTRYKKC